MGTVDGEGGWGCVGKGVSNGEGGGGGIFIG